MKKILLTLMVFGIVGCSSTVLVEVINPFEKFFTYDSIYNSEKAKSLLPTSDVEVLVIEKKDLENLYADSWARGFDVIGATGFTGQMRGYKSMGGLEEAIMLIKAKGKRIGATRAFFFYELDRVENPGSNSSINCFDGLCSSNTRNYSYRIYKQEVIYLAKNVFDKLYYGFQNRGLTLQEKTQYSTNDGIYISFIRNGLPFYNAGIVPGDIIFSQDGNKIKSSIDIKKTSISIFEIGRKGKRLNIKVTASNP
jgi:hypothetical protein